MGGRGTLPSKLSFPQISICSLKKKKKNSKSQIVKEGVAVSKTIYVVTLPLDVCTQSGLCTVSISTSTDIRVSIVVPRPESLVHP